MDEYPITFTVYESVVTYDYGTGSGPPGTMTTGRYMSTKLDDVKAWEEDEKREQRHRDAWHIVSGAEAPRIQCVSFIRKVTTVKSNGA